MLKNSVPIRDSRGKITKHAEFQNPKSEVGKINADRKWFSATRLAKEQTVHEMSPYEVYVKKGAIPFLTTEKRKRKIDYQTVFGKKARRTKGDFTEIYSKVRKEAREEKELNDLKEKEFNCLKEKELNCLEENKKSLKNANASLNDLKEKELNCLEENKKSLKNLNESLNDLKEKPEFNFTKKKTLNDTKQMDLKEKTVKVALKGQSKRIWKELYKVIDCSDVVIHVLDARDPLGTKCAQIEKYVKGTTKKIVYLLNKVDLVPTSVTAKYLRLLSKDSIALAYHANSLHNHYGTENLFGLLRQLSGLKGRIGVGLVGYPNVGKSSIINTLRNKKVCSVAPVAGQTKVYQFIKLDKKINLIDCPGVVPPGNYIDCVLNGAYRIENLEDPIEVFDFLLKKYENPLRLFYKIEGDFLENWCVRFGRKKKGGENDYLGAAKMVLNDWIRGRIPYFVDLKDIC